MNVEQEYKDHMKLVINESCEKNQVLVLRKIPQYLLNIKIIRRMSP